MIVAGFDPSLCSSGLIVYDGRLVLHRQIIKTKPTDGSVEKRARFIINTVLKVCRQYKVQWLGIENAAYGKHFRQFDLGRLHGVVRLILEIKEFPYVAVSPTELKQFGSGKGNANKQDMINACKKYLPDANSDEADAFHLARYVYEMVKLATVEDGILTLMEKPRCPELKKSK